MQVAESDVANFLACQQLTQLDLGTAGCWLAPGTRWGCSGEPGLHAGAASVRSLDNDRR